jgi:hypothetical protein
VASRTPRGGRDGSQRGCIGLALLVGVLLSLAAPVPSMADQSSSPQELWRAYPLRPDAAAGESRGIAAGKVSRPMEIAAGDAEDVTPDTAEDTRLLLQIGMLLAVLYVAFLCLWLSWMRRQHDVGWALRRVRSYRAAIPAAAADTPWTCEIAWKTGHMRSRFQAVIVTPDDRKRRIVAESNGLRWPPKDVRNPPTRELEAALETLIASIEATGWEPVQSPGSWSERRFVWRRPGEPPTMLRSNRRTPSPRPTGARRSRGAVTFAESHARAPRAPVPGRRRRHGPA